MDLARILVTIWLSVISLASANAGASVLRDDTFTSFVQRTLDTFHVPGVSVAVVHNGEISAKGYGLARLPATKATPDTLWFTASTTKAFTALAMAKIVLESKGQHAGVRWTTPINQILPDDFVLSDDYTTAHITVEDALSHRSGLPIHAFFHGWGNASTVDMIRQLRYLPFSAQPRTAWQYNNMMYNTIAEGVRKVTGRDLETTLREWVWLPLGMRSTTMSLKEAWAFTADEDQSQLARGYYWNREYYFPHEYYNLSQHQGAGAIISSVNDYALWIKALLGASNSSGSANMSSPLNHELYEAVVTPRFVVPSPDLSQPSTTYGLGWEIAALGEHLLITHGGALPGFGTQVYLLPNEGIGFVAMANTLRTSNKVGASIFVELLRRMGKLDDAFTSTLTDSGLTRIPSVHAFMSSTRTDRQPRSRNRIPLPGALTDYVGLYSHPAYGVFNVSVPDVEVNLGGSPESFPWAQIPMQSPSSMEIVLKVQPSARTWPSTLRLTHVTQLTFDAEVFWHFGVNGREGRASLARDCISDASDGVEHDEGPECRLDDVLELEQRGRAVFAYGLDGRVAQLGIELDDAMVKHAGEEGDWRLGMIWFDKNDG